ncbi:hypothetical protein DIZ76_011985 [Coccidioides immitis]|nr:hypothetical protein DIZ76_011985 [Coccidioides immitis]
MPEETFKVNSTFFKAPPGIQPGYFYRIYTASGSYKYLHADDPTPRGPDSKGENLDFKAIPKGNWVVGSLQPSRKSQGKFSLGATSTTPLKGIERTWHQKRVDIQDLQESRYVHLDEDEDLIFDNLWHLYSMPHIHQERAIGKTISVPHVAYFAYFPSVVELLQRESDMYRTIQGQGIGDEFLGYITESQSRIIGILVGCKGSESDFDQDIPGAEDIGACQSVLSKLQRLGISLGTVWPESFWIRNNKATISSFATCVRDANVQAMEREMKSVERAFADPLDVRNLSKELREQVEAIFRRDGKLHQVVIFQGRSHKYHLSKC